MGERSNESIAESTDEHIAKKLNAKGATKRAHSKNSANTEKERSAPRGIRIGAENDIDSHTDVNGRVVTGRNHVGG